MPSGTGKLRAKALEHRFGRPPLTGRLGSTGQPDPEIARLRCVDGARYELAQDPGCFA